MIPVELRSRRLLLDQPTTADSDLIVEYCGDPVFEHTMTLPWPYTVADADFFVNEYVRTGWSTDAEYTWALRHDGQFLGVIGYRFNRSDIGYWLGAPHRGKGYMPEALSAVTDWLFELGVERLGWECVVGNVASAAVARKAGLTFTGTAPAEIPYRDASHPASWHGVLLPADDRTEKPGWP